MKVSIDDARIINLPIFPDKRGNLSFIEENKHIPFQIKRTYWIYDVPGGVARGGHAYKENMEFIVALSGSFDVVLDDGVVKNILTQQILLRTFRSQGDVETNGELFD